MSGVNYSWTSHDGVSRRRALVATGLVQVVLLLVLLLLCFETPLPLPGEEGIAVSFGTEHGGAGHTVVTAPVSRPRVEASERLPEPEERKPEAQLTQDYEDAPEVAAKPAAAPSKPREVERPQPKPAQEEPKAEAPKPSVNPAALFPGRAASPAEPGRGSGGEAGNQGSPEGRSADGGMGVGQGDGLIGNGGGRGGGGEGISYSLGSRSALTLPPPEYPTQRSGKVVVKVWVNRQGRVLRAESGDKGSTTFDQALLQAAQAAAMQAQFDVSSDAPDTQVGSITYVFRLKQ